MNSARRSHRILTLLGCAAVCAAASPAAAQKPGWHSLVEANANMLFGATSQTLTSAAGAVSHVGEGFTADASVKFRYGESDDAGGDTFVSARGWALAASADFWPTARIVPFFFASTETSLEKRIANRSAGGVGSKWLFAKSNTGSASLSLALLGERTAALSDSALPVKRVVRWSWRVKMDQKVADRLSLSHVTFYAPIADHPSQYTVTSTSVGAYSINEAVALTLTLTDNYDSQAMLRGAPSNNDGALLFGIRSTF